MGAPLAVALGALHYLALFLQLGGATRPSGHAPWDNHVSGHGELGHCPRGLPHQTPPWAASLQLGRPQARTRAGRGGSSGAPPAGSVDQPWPSGHPCGGGGTPGAPSIPLSRRVPSSHPRANAHTSTAIQITTATATRPHLLLSHTHNSYSHTSQTPSQIPLRTHVPTTRTQQALGLEGSHPASWHPGAQLLPACLPADTLADTLMNTLCSPTPLWPSAFSLCRFNPTAILAPSLSTAAPYTTGKGPGGRKTCLSRTSLGCSCPCQVAGISGTKAWWEPLEDTGIVGIAAFRQRHGRGRGMPRAFVCLWGWAGSPCYPSAGYPPILISDPGGLKGGKSQLSHRGSQRASQHSQHWLPECQKLLLAPEEPKLAVELDCLKLAAVGALPAPVS